MPFFLLQSLSHLIRGSIVFISSRMGDLPHGRSIPYAVSKAGLDMLSKSLVKELPGVNINTIAVGFVDTDWHKDKSEEHIERIKSKIALERFGTPEEVAMLCSHLISNKYINGATINIDGGYNAK